MHPIFMEFKAPKNVGLRFFKKKHKLTFLIKLEKKQNEIIILSSILILYILSTLNNL